MAVVLYITRSYTTHDRRFVAALADGGHEVYYQPCECSAIVYEPRPLPDDVRLLRPLSRRPLAFNSTDVGAPLRRLHRVIETLQPDIVHAGPVPLGGFLAALTEFHPLIVMAWGSDVLIDALRDDVSRKIAWHALSRADFVIVDCRAVAQAVRELAGIPARRILTFPWGVDLAACTPALERPDFRAALGWSDNPVVVYARSWEPIHAPLDFIDAVAQVARQRGDVRALMLGDGPLAPDVRRAIAAHNLGEIINCPGRVSSLLLPPLMGDCNLYVSTSACDGSSITLLEAMAMGLPAIVPDVGGNREWVSQGVNGWRYPPGDVDTLARTLLAALSSEQLSEIAGENFALAHSRADWRLHAQTLLDAYERILQEEAKGGFQPHAIQRTAHRQPAHRPRSADVLYR
ncbi:Alpha-D-kanosaminyltransferase [Phycisphaerae bacterium RAS1]|nr:Alpha-D-kanosaminyltransferase [Phycisphaerae bacterium RAS1]